MIQNYINHIVFVVDRSGSMQSIRNEVVTVFDNEIKNLASRSKELNQETRVSVYLFGSLIECLIYDMDVLRLPSLKSHYQLEGMTKLIDATLKSIDDLKKTPELYGDHAHLLYVLTDGRENESRNTASTLSNTISKLPDNWTIGVMVPNQQGVFEAKKAGFAAGNIAVWSATKQGVTEVGGTIRQSTDNFMVNRSKGIRSTKNLFSLDTAAVSKAAVTKLLDPLKADEYTILHVRKDDKPIREFVESWKIPYHQGCAYYELSKPEKIQGNKNICLKDKKTGKVYTGDQARQMLGLPDYEVKVGAAQHPNFTLFIQSTSVNRKLVPGTELLVMK